jgi:hypothetical protein
VRALSAHPFLWQRNKLLPSFSLAQRKEAKETSTYPHPLPIWRGSTENCGYRQFSDFIKVKSGIKARFCFFFGLRQFVGANYHSPLSPSSPLSPLSGFISLLHLTKITIISQSNESFIPINEK